MIVRKAANKAKWSHRRLDDMVRDGHAIYHAKTKSAVLPVIKLKKAVDLRRITREAKGA